MKDFFKNYSYYSVKMFLNQFGIALFGMSLAMVFGYAKNQTGQVVSSICSVVFYLFLIYYMTWEVGAADSKKIKNGGIKERPLNGLYMSLLANSINLIFAVLVSIGVKVFGIFALLIEGMYMGIMTIPYKTVIENGVATSVPLNDSWWAYFLIIIPALLISTISYYLGTKNIHFTPIFDPVNLEEKEKKKENRKGK